MDQQTGCDPKNHFAHVGKMVGGDHFPGITKMVDLGSGAKRQIRDIDLTRYA